MLQKGRAVGVQLVECWTREYQVLPGRTHPLMTPTSSSGYVLRGYKVTEGHASLPPGVAAVSFGAPAMLSHAGDKRPAESQDALSAAPAQGSEQEVQHADKRVHTDETPATADA